MITLIDKLNADRYTWGSNCDSFVMLDTENLSVKQEIMPAGTSEVLHFHQKAQQLFYMLSGEALFHAEGKEYVLHAGQCIHVPAGTPHFIENKSGNILEFLVISEPSTNKDRLVA